MEDDQATVAYEWTVHLKILPDPLVTVIAVDEQHVQRRTIQPLTETMSRRFEMRIPFDTDDILVVASEPEKRRLSLGRELPINRYQRGV
jgi:hypothetical protein